MRRQRRTSEHAGGGEQALFIFGSESEEIEINPSGSGTLFKPFSENGMFHNRGRFAVVEERPAGAGEKTVVKFELCADFIRSVDPLHEIKQDVAVEHVEFGAGAFQISAVRHAGSPRDRSVAEPEENLQIPGGKRFAVGMIFELKGSRVNMQNAVFLRAPE